MTERKVLNKYYPPDYDPSRLPKLKKDERTRKWVQRVMAPFNMKCKTCNEYIYKGKKFNMRREKVEGEDYLGIYIWRFYMRCPKCLAEITFKTDLENCDYAAEHGSIRLFEADKFIKSQQKELQDKEEEEKNDAMAMLEKRTQMSRHEMDALSRLEELQEINIRQASVESIEKMLIGYRAKEQQINQEQEESDEALLQKLYGRLEDGKVLKRLVDDDDDGDLPGPSSSTTQPVPKKARPSTADDGATTESQKKSQSQLLRSGIVIRKKTFLQVSEKEPSSTNSEAAVATSTSAQDSQSTTSVAHSKPTPSLVVNYSGSSSSGEDGD